MVTKIKICGITSPDDARCAADCGADFVGLIFAKKSKRCVSVEQARAVAADGIWNRPGPPVIGRVGGFAGVFVDEAPPEIERVASDVRLYAVQLHGDESPLTASQTAERRRIVIKAFPVDSPAFAERINDWFGRVPAHREYMSCLLDGPGGGTGQPVNWNWVAAAKAAGQLRCLPGFLFLAGGLTPGNVGEAIRIVRPDVVDVSSGVESAPGVKDHAKIAAFCDAVRRADGR